MRWFRGLQREDGVGLVELLVVIAILSVIGGIVANGVIAGLRSTRDAQSRVQGLADLEKALERMGRELRAACPLRVVEANRVQVEVRRQTERRRYEYRLAGTVLYQKRERFAPATSSWIVVSDGAFVRDVANSSTPALTAFRYLKADGSQLAAPVAPTTVASIKIALRRSLRQQKPIQAETVVHLRNAGTPCT